MILGEILKKKNVDGLFGLEIELEGDNLPVINNKNWTTVRDGSLRNGMEYITPGAVDFEQAIKNIEYLRKATEKNKLNLSFRTSTHVHINVLDKSLDEITKIIYLYILFEEPLLSYCGDERKGNRFCQGIRDSEALVDWVITLFKEDAKYFKEEALRNPDILVQNLKYSAMNMATLAYLGTLEFRGMRATLDEKEMKVWLSAVKSLKESSDKFESCRDIYSYLVANGPMSLAIEVFGKELFDDLNIKEFHDMILYNSSLAISIPFEV